MGKFVVFDGMDRAGKTTALSSICKVLCKMDYTTKRVTTDKLAGNRIPSLVGHYPDEVVYMLFWQAIREAELSIITPSLEKDEIVLTDRHYLSNLAYDWWNDLDPEFKRKMDEVYLERCMKPDLLLLFTIPYEKFVERDDGDTVLDRPLFEAIQSGYLWWARKLAQDGINVVYVDGSNSIDDVAVEVLTKVSELLST